MPNDPRSRPHHRPYFRPGTDFDQRAIPVTHQPQRNWFRVHRTGSPAAGKAPVPTMGICPHHRFSHANCPYPLLYLGASLSVCLWEYFGDDIFRGKHVISAARWDGCSIGQIQVPQLKVCAVTLESTRNAMVVDKASLLATDLSVPQEWGLAVQKHPAGFEAIKYSSRFIDQPCLALFDRGGMSARLKTKSLGELNHLDAAVDWLHEHEVALV